MLPSLVCLVIACGDADGTPNGGGSGGSGGGGGNCLAEVPSDCDLAFAPTYDAFFDNLLGRTCGASSTGASCHAPDGAMGGLVLGERETAYDYLLGEVDGRARVVPGEPECSEVVKRILSDDPEYQMPPSDPLSAEERCSIVQWIEMGAER